MPVKKNYGQVSFIQPLDSFCCGCHLDVGVKFIIFVHSLTSMFYIYTCFFNIVLEQPTFGYNVTLYTQTFNCAWGLASIPFIASGISGVRNHVEIHLRVYLYWLIFSVGFDLVMVVCYLFKTIWHNPKVPGFLANEGGAFASGAMRLFSIVLMLILFGFASYGIFVVWSRCEELQDSGSEPQFDFLLGESRMRKNRWAHEHKSGLFGTGVSLPSHGFPIMYGSLASPGIGAGGKIFQGRHHETEFPPKHMPSPHGPSSLDH